MAEQLGQRSVTALAGQRASTQVVQVPESVAVTVVRIRLA